MSFKVLKQFAAGCCAIAVLGLGHARQPSTVPTQQPNQQSTQQSNPSTAQRSLQASALPTEAQTTLALIAQGGPFPYAKDGVVFGNYERQLPAQRRGYYHEYTVPTPGARSRGARRIIVGGKPPTRAEYFYTGDHYASFQRIQQNDRPK